MKPASRKMILWILRLVLASGRMPTAELVQKLQSLTQNEIKSVMSRAQSARDRYFRETRTKLEDWGDLHGPAEACFRGDFQAARDALVGRPSKSMSKVQFAPAAGSSGPNSYTDSSPF